MTEAEKKKTESKQRLKERVRLYRLRKVARAAFTQEQLEEFRELLETQRHHITGEKNHLSGTFKSELRLELERGRASNHIADTNPENSLVTETLVNNRSKRLPGIEAALKRLDDGVYGVCQACETAIDIPRLLSEPASRFHASCKIEYNAAEAQVKNGRGTSRGSSSRYLTTPAYA